MYKHMYVNSTGLIVTTLSSNFTYDNEGVVALKIVSYAHTLHHDT